MSVAVLVDSPYRALDILPHQLRADDRFIAGDRAQLEDVQGIADISAAVAGDQLSRFGIQLNLAV